MKKKITILTVMLCAGIFFVTACNGNVDDPGTPPASVVHPEDTSQEDSNEENDTEESGETVKDADNNIRSGAVSIRIGRDSEKEYDIDMYDNAAVDTMLGYLSDSDLLFPTYTYDDEEGYVEENIRGNYTRDDEMEVADIHTGELYLFGDGQLRLYFKDVEGADIKATPVGYVVETEDLTETVQDAYESNRDDTWGVDVYFWITKH